MDIMTGFEFDNEIAKELRKLKFVMWRYSKLQPKRHLKVEFEQRHHRMVSNSKCPQMSRDILLI